MPQPDEYVAILRCQTWNVWPEKSGTEHRPFSIDFGASAALSARLIVISDPVKLAAIKDALDRSGLAAKNAVSVELGITKPFERVFDSIISGPRYSEAPTALAAESERPAIESANAATESDNGEILSEFDDDPLSEGDEGESLGDFASDPLRIQRQRESESTVIDVEVVDAGYTDAIMSDGSGTAYPRSRSNPARRAHSPGSRTTRADWPSG